MKIIDLRSDTVTKPTPEMRQAMYEAPVGDDVYGDDRLTNELEALMAKLTGKQAGLFVPSGTFGNQLAVLTHTQPSNEVILGVDCHIVAHEGGASGLISGVQLRTLNTVDGQMSLDDIAASIREDDIHYPKTALICLENAYGSGVVAPLDYMKAVYALARQHDVAVHLDGARLFNAATALGVSVDRLASYADSVNICLSKGLCAPIGSVLVGSAAFIARARRYRKKMGGGMRQTGILASAGLVAVKQMAQRLAEDHQNAQRLADGLAAIDGIAVNHKLRDINMVFFTVAPGLIEDAQFVSSLAEKGILINGFEEGYYRFVTHYWISQSDVDDVVQAVRAALAGH